MTRYFLAAYMLLLSVCGPNVCCCSLARMTSFIRSRSQLSNDTQSSLNCCSFECCQGTSEAGFNDDDAPRRDGLSNEPAQRHRCKCKQLANAADPRPAAEFVVELSRSWELAFQCLAMSTVLPVRHDASTSLGLVLAESTSHGSRSGREIRIDLHAWRC